MDTTALRLRLAAFAILASRRYDSNTACQCMHRHNVYGYITTGASVSTYLVRIVSQWDSVKKLLFQNEIEVRG